MQYFGGKLSAAQLQVSGWVGNVRRSLQGALELLWGAGEEGKDGERKEEDEAVRDEEVENGGGRFQRAVSPLRGFARRSRRSLRRLSVRHHRPWCRRTGDTCSEQLESLSPDGGVLDTEALLEREPEHQHEACKHTPEAESPKSVPDLEPGVTSDDLQVDTESELPSFPESSARLLDNHAQRSRAELIKRRSQRTRLPRTRQSSMLLHTETSDPDWRACDSTEETERINPKGTDSEEEEPAGLKEVSSPPPAAQQVPVIPRLALSNSALLAHLKKKTRGGGEETVEDKDGPSEEPSPTPTPTPTQLSRSPRSPALLPGAARVLPPIGGKDEGTGSSPSWLKELRTKKRLSQHDGGT